MSARRKQEAKLGFHGFIDSRTCCVAGVADFYGPDAEKNRALFLASPSLSEKLRRALELLEAWGHDGECRHFRARGRALDPDTIPCDCNLEEDLAEIRTVIAKAEGKS